jgi:hypothetical protein
MTSSKPHPPVRRRAVFYIPGYDPMPPRSYRERYRREAARQAALSGHEIALKPGEGEARDSWTVTARIEGAAVQTTITVLAWADIVRASMSGSIAATYLQLLRTAWVYLSTGALFRLMRLRKGPVIAALFPVAVLLGELVLAVALGVVVGGLVAGGIGWVAGAAASLPVSVLAGLAIAWAMLRWFKARDGKVFAYYLMHDYAYSARFRGANPPELEARLADFTDIGSPKPCGTRWTRCWWWAIPRARIWRCLSWPI